jgi:F0F1-type ATP synthase assembly protein I
MSDYSDNEQQKPKHKSHSDEKMHSAFEQSYPDYSKNKRETYSNAQDRGGCLTAFLGVQFMISAIAILAACFLVMDRSSSYGSIGMIVFLIAGIRMGLLVGVWNWNQIAYQLLLGLYGISIVLGFFSGNFQTAILSLIEGGIFYVLIQDKVDEFY